MKNYTFDLLQINNDITTIFNDKIWDRYRACQDGIADYIQLDMEAISHTKSSLMGKKPLYVHAQWTVVCGHPVKCLVNLDQELNNLIFLN